MNSSNSPTTKPLFRGVQLVGYILGLLEVLLAFRFVLRLTAANSGAGFTSFIYHASHPFVAPFLSVFRISQVSGSIFEWTTLLAMIVYAMIAWGLTKLFTMSRTVSTPEAAVKLDQKDKS